MADIKDFRNKNTRFTGTEGIRLPVGGTGQRPTGEAGETRFNSDTGSIEFFDGLNWVATNLIPNIDSISGTIYQGVATDLTLTLSNATDNIDVIYSEGGIELAVDSAVSVSSGSATSTVPAAVYNQSAGDTIIITIRNQDGTPSANQQTRTVTALPSGGTITTYNDGTDDYRIHTFTSDSTFVNTVPNLEVEYLIIGGGGSGGVSANSGGGAAGGGGAGGYRESLPFGTEARLNLNATSYGVTVGLGGASRSGTGNGNQGGNSSFAGITSLGGGYGGGNGANGNSGGSGGGDGGGADVATYEAYGGGAAGTPGQGNNGGDGTSNAGGGGGGANQQGRDSFDARNG